MFFRRADPPRLNAPSHHHLSSNEYATLDLGSLHHCAHISQSMRPAIWTRSFKVRRINSSLQLAACDNLAHGGLLTSQVCTGDSTPPLALRMESCSILCVSVARARADFTVSPTSTSHPPTPSPIPTQHDDSEWHIYLPGLFTHTTSSYVSRAPRCALALLLIVELRASQPAVPPRRPRPLGREGWGARGGRGATGTADTLVLLYFLAMCYLNHYAWTPGFIMLFLYPYSVQPLGVFIGVQTYILFESNRPPKSFKPSPLFKSSFEDVSRRSLFFRRGGSCFALLRQNRFSR